MDISKITKIDLVNSVYEKTGYDKRDIQVLTDALLLQIKAELENGHIIELRGFGTFEPRLRKGRSVARNPRTGQLCSVEPHYVAAFRAGKELKENLFNLNKDDLKKSK